MWMALAQLGMAGYSAYNKNKAFDKQINSLNKLKNRSPEEMKYYNDLRSRSARGGINVQQQMNRRMPGIQATQQETLQSQMGGLYGSGLENSVIADELKRKTHRSTLQQIQKEAQGIADKNLATQQQATKEMADYGRRRTELLNNIGQQQDALRGQQKSHLQQSIMGGAIGMATGLQGGSMADVASNVSSHMGTPTIPGLQGQTPLSGGGPNIQSDLQAGKIQYDPDSGTYMIKDSNNTWVPIGKSIPAWYK